MATMVMLVRNPYPVPDVSREGNWIQDGPYLGKNIPASDRRWYTRLQPHERLFAHHTLNSVRKDSRFLRPKVPTDALDYALSSVYEHCNDSFLPKMYTHIQPETLGRETWRVLRNQIKTFSKAPSAFGHPLRHASGQEEHTISEIKSKNGHTRPKTSHTREESKRYSERRAFSTTERKREGMRKIHPSSLKLAIDGPHMDQTNAGYSRKKETFKVILINKVWKYTYLFTINVDYKMQHWCHRISTITY
ncbi:uncharacterized protein LOC117178003 isoform X2 [Belonocnema kinseyi]|nr:uncharacterized protein LOC117178003 isoform X2 [Belonocnema kinseyi]XP_033225066.1 uncharacterized protein LOC117178003 isoform X2 [Belonocnema kinseyi]XP_033225067.1 uncharacterized protein LOC117178003 isoform X2 [Belonocnema kinseyi]XP_033225068.1 uncharacterized protein LOC117178003 isoform X2 [Belonocnema kinseyi]XP_033225069.1 uncharacterized protein LOC117178003 isoform X2 [Belonocnema kinseyi]